MSVTRITAIAVAVSALWCGSAGAAGPLRAFKHGFWEGGANTDDRTGVFTHCSAGVVYDSGINLFVLATRGHKWWLGFFDRQWSLPPNPKVSVKLRFDNGAPFEQFATIPSGQLILVPLPDSSHLINAFRRTSKLYLVAEGRSFFFKLSETSAVMDQLTSCVRTSVALETHGMPAGTTGATPPTSSETQIASPGTSRSSEAAGPPPASASTTAANASGSPAPIAALAAPEAHPSPAGQTAAALVTPGSPAETTRAMSAWVSMIALGALMGVVGQGIRVIVGLKKARDEAVALGHKFIETIEPMRLTISLLIGAVAGVMAAIATTPGSPISREALLGLGAAGYSGADLIEGLMVRYLSGRTQPSSRFGTSWRQELREDDKDG